MVGGRIRARDRQKVLEVKLNDLQAALLSRIDLGESPYTIPGVRLDPTAIVHELNVMEKAGLWTWKTFVLRSLTKTGRLALEEYSKRSSRPPAPPVPKK